MKMARKTKIKSVEIAPGGVTVSSVESSDPGVLVDVREVTNPRPLVRVTEDATAWSWSVEAIREFRPVPFAPGSIVRLDPPVDVEDAKVDAIREIFSRAGAAAVRVSARRKNDVVVIEPAPGAVVPKRVIGREAVESLVETANVDDRPALKALCEEMMSKAGL